MRQLPAFLLLGGFSLGVLAQDASPNARVKAGLGGAAVDAVARFDYRLQISDAAGRLQRAGHYSLLPAQRRLYVREALPAPAAQTWSGPDGTWRLSDAQWEFLGESLASPLRQHVAYNFLALLRDPKTQYSEAGPDRVRIAPAGADAFEVQLDTATGRILENRFGPDASAREFDYRDVGGVHWPMSFDVVVNGAVTRRGRFSHVRVGTQAELPAMTMASAPPRLPDSAEGVARLAGAGWLSGDRNDYNLSLDAHETRLVFARSQPEFKQAQIWSARREGEHWSAPQPVPFSDARYSDSDPWLTPDGKTLYFVSNRPVQGDTPRGDLDLWRVRVSDVGFGAPEHLAAVSGVGQELGPEVHDGWLYFNSSRPGGPARLSIYRARLSGNGFDAPQPLDAPFNAGQAQGDFTLSPDGRTALFWSIRDGSQDGDLFAAVRDGANWSKAVRLPSPINADGFDFTPAFSADGRTLRFASMRKPAWLGEDAPVFNGQSNMYVVPATMVHTALLAAATGSSAARNPAHPAAPANRPPAKAR